VTLVAGLRTATARDDRRVPSRALRRLAVATVLVTYLLVVWGGVVRVSGSGLGCGTRDDWPLCQGRLLPHWDEYAVIEFTHRWLAAMATALVVALVAVAWMRYRHLRRITIAATAVAVLFVVQILLGAATVELKLPGSVVMVHLANALLLLGALVFIAVQTFAVSLRRVLHRDAEQPVQAHAARRMAFAAGATYLLVLSGALVVADGAGAACAGWPLCGNGFQLDSAHLAEVNLLHRIVAGVVALFVGYATAMVMRHHRGSGVILSTAVAINVLLLAQIAAGALVVELRLPATARGIHLALASGLFATTTLLALLVNRPLLDDADARRAPIAPRALRDQPAHAGTAAS
jgi:cytochrome c oxidase assembly protein subunit 15